MIFISVVIFLVCILLLGVILVQNSKGGGLSSSFAGSNQIIGVRKTADFLEKATWSLAIGLLGLSLLSAALQGSGTTEGVQQQQSEIEDFVNREVTNFPTLPPQPVPTGTESAPAGGDNN